MKKLALILFVSFISISSFSQNYYTSKFWNLLTADTIKVNEWLMYQEDTIWFPTYTNARDLQIKNMADPIELTDGVNLQTLLANAGGFDSIDYNISDNGLLRLLSSEILVLSVSMDGRHVEYSDSTLVFVTPTQLNDSLSNYVTPEILSDSLDNYATIAYVDSVTVNSTKNVYRITLPIAGDLNTSVTNATDVPPGWVLAAIGGDLQVTHSLGRYSSAVRVKYNNSGANSYRHTKDFEIGYSGLLDTDNDILVIESISEYYKSYKLQILISF